MNCFELFSVKFNRGWMIYKRTGKWSFHKATGLYQHNKTGAYYKQKGDKKGEFQRVDEDDRILRG